MSDAYVGVIATAKQSCTNAEEIASSLPPSPKAMEDRSLLAMTDVRAWLPWPERPQCPYGHTTNGHTQALLPGDDEEAFGNYVVKREAQGKRL